MTLLDATGVALDCTYRALENPMAKPLPPDPEPVGECANLKCRASFYEGEKVLEYDGEHYCDVYCLAEGLGAEKVEL